VWAFFIKTLVDWGFFRETPVFLKPDILWQCIGSDEFPAAQRSLPRAAARDGCPRAKPRALPSPVGDRNLAVSHLEPPQMLGYQGLASGLTDNTDIISGWGSFLFLPREHQHFLVH